MGLLKIDPYINGMAQMPITPVLPQAQQAQQAGGIGITTPLRKQEFSFGHLTGLAKNGPGALLQAKPGETSLADEAIQLANNKEAGRRLYIAG